MYSQAGYNLKQTIEKNEGNNKMDKKEIENIKDYYYFVNILDKIDYTKITNINEHYEYLLSSMLIYQAPVRTSLYTSCQIIWK